MSLAPVLYGVCPYLRLGARTLLAGGSALQEPFVRILDEERVTDPFIRNWLDMICFLLQGATTDEAPAQPPVTPPPPPESATRATSPLGDPGE